MANELFSLLSWDQGLRAQKIGIGYDEIHIAGTRIATGDWSQTPVNFMAGASLDRLLGASGNLSFDLIAEGSSYGSGTGYKTFVQFWNDPSNYIAVGLISDPGITGPGKYTLMVEGASNGTPIGGYWGRDMPQLGGNAHHFEIQWENNQIGIVMDGLTQYTLRYDMALTNPSISYLGAGRMAGDAVQTRFDNITFSDIGLREFSVPETLVPRAYIEADVQLSGSGLGYAAYLNLHDQFGNAIAFGYQYDQNSRDADAAPMLHFNQTGSGQFSGHRYYDDSVGSASEHWRLAYYENAFGDQDVAVFFIDGTPLAYTEITLQDRVFFQAEINGAGNGDQVQTSFSNVRIGGQWSNGNEVRPNGVWNTQDFDFWGLDARQLDSEVQGADFSLAGVVAGLPAGQDWDTIETLHPGQPVAGVAMIAEWWFGM